MKPESARFSPVGKGDTGAFHFKIQFLTLGTFSRIREKRVACPIRPLGLAPARIEREQAWFQGRRETYSAQAGGEDTNL